MIVTIYHFIVGSMTLHHNPWLLSTIGMGIIPIAVPLLAVFVVVKRMTGNNPIQFPKGMAPAVAFVALAALSIVFAESKVSALIAGERVFVRVLLFPWVAWLIFISLRPEAQVQFLSRQNTIVVFMAFVGIVLSFLQVLTGKFYFISPQWSEYQSHSTLFSRPIGIADYPTAWGIFLLIPFFMLFAEALSRRVLWKWFAIGVTLVAIGISGTRSTWLGALVGMLWLFSKARHRLRATPLVIFTILIAVLILFGVEGFYNILGQRMESVHEGLISRLPLLLAAVKMGASHPITGVGIGNFPVYWLKHANEIMGGFMVGYWISFIKRGEMPMPHNMFLGVWAEMGGFGLFTLIWLLWRGWQNFHLFSLPSRMDDSLSRGISLMRIRDGLQAAYLAIIVSSFFQPIEHYLFLWFLLATSFMLKSYARACKLTSPLPDSGVSAKY